MKGNRTIITPDRGCRVEGIIDTAEKPGTVLQYDPGQAVDGGGRFHWVVYDRGADGERPAGPYIVLCEDFLQGKTATDAYTAATRAVGFIPWAGCELNLLFKNVAGTADDVVPDASGGSLLIVDDGTGKLIVTTGTVEEEPFMALEALTDPSADTLLWCVRCG